MKTPRQQEIQMLGENILRQMIEKKLTLNEAAGIIYAIIKVAEQITGQPKGSIAQAMNEIDKKVKI